MTHIFKSTISAGNRISDVTASPDVQATGLEKLAELARNASPEIRDRLESTIALVTRSRQIRSMTLKAVEQGSLLTEAHSMDEESHSLAESHILDGRTRQ
ncbi:hypothetical protein GGE65_007302 [Skermanella aerolata]|uniref:hypothetical protein n=1 Tax=Skermanella aerolata TaxID=393310 RepID=UPI003D24B8DE